MEIILPARDSFKTLFCLAPFLTSKLIIPITNKLLTHKTTFSLPKQGLAMRQFSPLLLLLGLSLLVQSSLGDRLSLRRPLLGRRNKPVLKHFRLHDTDLNFFPFTDDTDSSSSHDDCIESSVPRLLQQPFQEALRLSPRQDRPEIETEKLLKAIRKLKDSMNAVGQDRNAAEIERNLQKIQSLYRIAPKSRRETLRSLLEYEKELGVHGPDGRLKDPSGAMGLLWIRRSLAFQERMYSLILDNAMKTNEAALQGE